MDNLPQPAAPAATQAFSIETISGMLDDLANSQSMLTLMRSQQDRELEAAMADIKPILLDISARWDQRAAVMRQTVADLEKAIKAQVESMGHTVKGKHTMAVFVHDSVRASWNDEALQGYAAASIENFTAPPS